MMGEPKVADFPNIYLGGKNGSLSVGRLKLADQGIAFRESATGEVTTVKADNMRKLAFLRAAKGYELKVVLKDGHVYKFDGFSNESFDEISSFARNYYDVPLDRKELSLKGWNWGRTDFQGDYITFDISGKQAFEVPVTEIANSTVAGKNEVSLEFMQGDGQSLTAPTGGNKRSESAMDHSLVEMRFFIPGMAKSEETEKKKKPAKENADGDAIEVDGDEEEEDDDAVYDEEGEAMTAAMVFYETIKQRANLGVVVGESLCSFAELLCLTPRARYDLEVYPTFLRLRGKSHDYKILYGNIRAVFSLPKPDDINHFLVIGLENPIVQGNTKYSFFVFQFPADEEVELEINMDEEELKKAYDGKLEKKYDLPLHQVFQKIFPVLTNKKISSASDKYLSAHGAKAVKCSLKANESYLYPLDKAFAFFPKPPTLIPYSDIAKIEFSRVSATAAVSSTKTFEMSIMMSRGGAGEHIFGNINREEYQALSSFVASKGIKVFNNLNDEVVGKRRYDDMDTSDVSGSDSDAGNDSGEEGRSGSKKRKQKQPQQPRIEFAGGDDDSESEDEDFVANSSGSDVDEEFDEEYSSDSDDDSEKGSGSGSDSDGSGGGSDNEGESSKKKKSKRPSKEKKSSSSSSSKKKRASNDEPSPKKRKTGKKEKDPNAPKRGMSGFMFFSNAKRDQVRSENPELKFGEIGKHIGELWKNLSAEDKKPYEEMAAKDKERYEREMKDYKPKEKSGGSPSAPSKSSSKPTASKAKESSLSKETIDSDEDSD